MREDRHRSITKIMNIIEGCLIKIGNGINKKRLVEYVILNLIVLIGLSIILKLWNANIWKYPLESGGDATQVLYNFAQLKETGLFGYSIRSSVPYYAYMSDFPALGNVERLFRWLFISALGNVVAAVNIIYILGYFLSATTSFWALRRLKISREVSMVVAILYAFMPYHFKRGISHLGFGLYWPIPIFIFFCISYLNREEVYKKGDKGWINKSNILHVAILIIIGGASVYFTFF